MFFLQFTLNIFVACGRACIGKIKKIITPMPSNSHRDYRLLQSTCRGCKLALDILILNFEF